jgi:hypothetical protein
MKNKRLKKARFQGSSTFMWQDLTFRDLKSKYVKDLLPLTVLGIVSILQKRAAVYNKLLVNNKRNAELQGNHHSDKLSMEHSVFLLREKIIDEIFFALGLGRDGWRRKILGPLFHIPANHFAKIAIRFENEIHDSGLNGGARSVLVDFSLRVTADGTQNIPSVGPVLIICNHPGAYDSLVMAASIPRKDLKMLVSDVPFAHALEKGSQYFIYVDFQTMGGMLALRKSIQHLKSGGCLLMFANGEVEPDPAIMPGAENTILHWSHSIEIMLHKAPQTSLVIAMVSGVLLPQFTHSLIARIRHKSYERQKLAEFLQVIQQMVLPSTIHANVHVTFSKPMDFSNTIREEIMPEVIRVAGQMLDDHIKEFSP